MKQKVFFILFFINLLSFGQSKELEPLKQNNDLENYLYQILDHFLENPTKNNLHQANKLVDQLWRNPTNKNEHLAMVIFLCNNGFYLNKFNQQANAIQTYEKGWSIYNTNKLEGYNIVEYCLKPLGNLYTILGDYQNAENTIKSYLYLSENNQEQKIAALINLSVVYQNTGRFNDAINILTSELKLKKINSLSEAKIISNIATNYISLKDDKKALEYLNSLKKLTSKNKVNDTSLKINIHKLSTLIAINKQDYEEAEIELKNTLKLIQSSDGFNPRSLAKFYLEYATILKDQNKLDDALYTIEKAIQNLIPNYQKETLSTEKLYAETIFIDAFDLIASIYTLKNDKETALNYYDLSFKIENLLSALYLYEETKLFQLNDNRIRSEKCIQLYYELYQETNNEKHINDAFLLAEKTKATILKETIIKKQKQLLLKKDTLVSNQLFLEKQNNEIKSEFIKEQLKGNKANVIYMNQLIEFQNKNSLKLKDLKKQIKVKYPHLHSDINEINIPILKEKLKVDKATIIEYFYGKEALFFFTINENKIKLSRIEDIQKVNTTILEFNSYFDDASKIVNDVLGYNSSAYELYELLNIHAVEETKNLIIIPDNVLNFTPFETLLTQKTQNINFSKLPYLLNKHQILYNTSAEFYLKNNNRLDELSVLGVFPVFEDTAQPLNYSINESEAIKKLFSGTYLMNKEASNKNFIRNISNHSILHLSTHASSGDYITPSSIQFYDETISLYDLYSLNINPNLVVLSACETGIGKSHKGEGALSIARGFQYSGANNLLFSLWKVNDLSTSMLMTSFYQDYKKTQSGYISNHHAKLVYLKNKDIDNVKKSPYYWGSFVYYGSLESPHMEYTYYILVIVLVLILLFLLLKFKHAKS